MDRVATWVAEWTRAKSGVLEYIDAMPEDGMAFKPVPAVLSFAEQMLHIATTQFTFAALIGGVPNPYTADAQPKMNSVRDDKAALRATLEQSHNFMIGVVRDLTEAQLDEVIPFFKGEMPRGLLLAKALEHQVHHRGQTTIYLRLHGVKPPSERLF